MDLDDSHAITVIQNTYFYPPKIAIFLNGLSSVSLSLFHIGSNLFSDDGLIDMLTSLQLH